MTIRREIAEPRRETSARSPEDSMRTRAVRGESDGRARWPEAYRSSGSAIAAEALMNNAGEPKKCQRMNVRGPGPLCPSMAMGFRDHRSEPFVDPFVPAL
jgi:hypothetical protein